jgi:hypothetical protein
MPRLQKGQRPFDKTPLPMRTCHDIRLWTACSHCAALGSKSDMLKTAKNQFWHGRCFAKRFGVERLLGLPREETGKLRLDDLGVALMRALIGGRP